MYILRSVKKSDFDDLFKLSTYVSFINLPADKEFIRNKIQNSLTSFENPTTDFTKNYYLFALEDCEEKEIIGVSMIHAQHGSSERPHFYLKVGKEHKFSDTTNTGFIHGTLKLGYDTDGPTEIGGLVLRPEKRGSGEKLGKQLSFVRFLYMAMNPTEFKKEIHTELMPPLDKNGNSPLWEAIGRRFMNMDYQDADILSRSNKEFILSLYPSDTIYETLLPPIARNSIGKIGEDTKPVKNMLEKIGFKYINEVDPFDGGPHYRAKLKDIKVVKQMFMGTVRYLADSPDTDTDKLDIKNLLIKIVLPDASFAAIHVKGYVSKIGDENIINIIDATDLKRLNLTDGFITNGIYF